MKKILLFLLMICIFDANAQNYLITFAGTGESNTVATVKVENLTSGATLTLNGTDILRLNISTGINPGESRQLTGMNIYPNPVTDKAIIKFYPPAEGIATIFVVNNAGKIVSQVQSDLDNSLQEFLLSGITDGLYLITVRGKSYAISGKLISNNKSTGKVSIEKISNNTVSDISNGKHDSKGLEATVDMIYASGQLLKFTGISGNYTTILTDAPSSDKTITFNFVECTDGDGNDYPVIGTGTGEGKSPGQIWMAANLKTTKFNDGTLIPHVTDNTEWSKTVSPAYCWYNNDESEYRNVYGALYNWYTVSTGKLCPAGWHVPGDEEWITFITFLGGEKVAGGNLKETGTAHWISPNTDAVNLIGFTAIPGGYRYINGAFLWIGGYNKLWSSSESNQSEAWLYYISYSQGSIQKSLFIKNHGLSVRCVKD